MRNQIIDWTIDAINKIYYFYVSNNHKQELYYIYFIRVVYSVTYRILYNRQLVYALRPSHVWFTRAIFNNLSANNINHECKSKYFGKGFM